MKPLLITTVLLLAPLMPQQHAQAQPIQTSVEPGFQIKTVEQIKPLGEPHFKTYTPLDIVGLSFEPLGTFTSNYEAGQCTFGVASMKGNIPNWGNANQWDDAARAAGYTVSDIPIIGAVAVSNTGGYGHVAVVTAVLPDHIEITEMNYDFAGSVRTRVASYGEFVYIYI